MQWNHLGPSEDTWELEDAMKEAYLFLFSFVNIEGNVVLRGRGM